MYDISGSAYYGESSWRDEGVYPYFYSPIIKNYDYTYLSYDNAEGGWAVLFSGKKGDVVLFKEGPSAYYPAQYPISGKIEKVDTVPAPVGTLVESTEAFKVCAIEIKTAGEYKFEDFSDELFDPNAGEWGMYYGRGYTVFGTGYSWYYPGTGTAGNDILPEVITLEPGTYYVAMGTFDNYEDEHIPAARFKLTKLSGSDDAVQISATGILGGVAYEIKGDIPDNATLYAALYAGTRLVEVKALENPDVNGQITFDNKENTNTCKLYLWDDEYEPICDGVICE